MEYIEKIKKMLCNGLEEYAMKGKLTMSEVDIVHKLTDTFKNLNKIAMQERKEKYSEAGADRVNSSYMDGSSYDNDMMYSERKGRGRNAKRDSLGRYSSDDGMSYDDYSEDRIDRRYSRDDAKDHMMSKLGSMMENADPNEREILKDAMRKIERA